MADRGDVERRYAIFRSDWSHVLHGRAPASGKCRINLAN
jgi:hypothetical protein